MWECWRGGGIYRECWGKESGQLCGEGGDAGGWAGRDGERARGERGESECHVSGAGGSDFGDTRQGKKFRNKIGQCNDVRSERWR